MCRTCSHNFCLKQQQARTLQRLLATVGGRGYLTTSSKWATDRCNLLPPNQEAALQALLSGQGVTGAAEAASVSRQRVSYWLHRNSNFIACYNERRQRMAEEFADKLRALGTKAIDRIEAALDIESNLDAAKFIVRLLATFPQDYGATLPSDVEVDIAERTALKWDRESLAPPLVSYLLELQANDES